MFSLVLMMAAIAVYNALHGSSMELNNDSASTTMKQSAGTSGRLIITTSLFIEGNDNGTADGMTISTDKTGTADGLTISTVKTGTANGVTTSTVKPETAVGVTIYPFKTGTANGVTVSTVQTGTADGVTTVSTVRTVQTKVNSAKLLLQKIEHIQNFYVSPPVCFIGIIGNGLVAAILYNKRGNNSSFIFMFALLLADNLSLISDLLTPLSYLLDLSTSAQKVTTNLRHYNEIFVSFVLRCTSINILCVLSVERFIAIKFPLHLKLSWTARYPKIFILISILVALFSNSLQLFHFKFSDVNIKGSNDTVYKKGYTDFYVNHRENIDKVVIFMKMFSGPVQILFFSVMNILIVYGIRQNSKSVKMINSTRTRSTNIQVKLCKIFILLSVLNAAAFLPNSVMPIIARLFPNLGLNIMDPSTKLILQSFKFCRVLNSANDFIIFFAMSKETRQDLWKKCLFCRLQVDMRSKSISSNSSNRTDLKT